jgi:hypothetical protein
MSLPHHLPANIGIYEKNVSTRLVLSAIVATILLGGCGGDGSSRAGSGAAGTTVTATSVTTSTAPAPAPAAPTLSRGATSPGSSQATSPATARTTTATTVTTTGAPAGGAQRVRLPATFTVRPGGRLDPPTVSSPAFLAVEVTVISRDGRSHRVVVRVPSPRTLSVPAGGRASVLIGGLRQGRYGIDLDGAPRGALEIGGEPGP